MSKPRKPEVSRNERTSKRIASIAGKVLAFEAHQCVLLGENDIRLWLGGRQIKFSWSDIRALAASCLNQAPDRPKWSTLPVKAAPKAKRTKTFMGFDIVVKNKRGPGAKPLGKFKRRVNLRVRPKKGRG